MDIKFREALGRAWKYGKEPKRLGVYAALLILQFFVYAILAFVPFFGSILSTLAMTLISSYTVCLFVYSYANKTSLSKSSNAARPLAKKYFIAALVMAISVMAIILLSLVLIVASPILFAFVMFVAVMFAVLSFFFIEQHIVIGKTGALEALRSSHELFMKNKMDVFKALLFIVAVSIGIILVFSIPFMLVFFTALAGVILTGSIASLLYNIPMLVLTGILVFVGIVLTAVLMLYVKTDIYMQMIASYDKTKRPAARKKKKL